MGVGLERRRLAGVWRGTTAPPDRRWARATPAFVGRGRELAALTTALVRPPGLVLVEGEAGIGKSRLIQEYLASPEARRSRTLVATCPPFRESLTLGPIVDAIRQAAPTVDRLELSALAGALRPLFPEWAADLPPAPEPLEDAKAARYRLLSALAELVERLEVLVLVVEDAHWADEATVEFLLLLTSRQQQPSLIVTYRPEDVPDGSLLWRLSSHAPAAATSTRLTLQPLDLSTTASLVSSMLDGEPLSEEFAGYLYNHTDGVPLLVEESVRLLRDRADLVRRDGKWFRHNLEELQVPPTVRDSTLERMGRLPSAAQRVLEAAAVLAEPASETIITTVAGLSASAGVTGVQAAVTSGLAEEDPRGDIRFRHVLPASAVYGAIPGSKRRRLHLCAGQVLEEVDPLPVAQLTRHFREAGETAKWTSYAEQAADQAVASNDHTLAARLLSEVLTRTDSPGRQHARLAAKLGEAALVRREAVHDELHRHVVSTLRAVLARAELGAREQAEVRSRLGRLLGQLGDWDAAYAELERAAVDLTGDPVAAARTMTYLGWPFAGQWPASVHLRWLGRATAVEPLVESPIARLTLTADRATALLLLGANEGWSVADTLPRAASSDRERRELARGYFNLAAAALMWGWYPAARHQLVTATELAEIGGYSVIRLGLHVMQIYLDWFTGAWDGLESRLTAVLETEDTEQADYNNAMLAMGWLRAAQGSSEEAKDLTQRALCAAHRLDDTLRAAAMLGRLRLATGDADEVLRLTVEPLQAVAAKGIWLWATEIAPVRVEALVATGRVDEASQLVARFARGLRGRDAPAPRAALALCRAILAEGNRDNDHAATAFGRAARAWERLPRPYDVLLARERQAVCLLGTDRAEAGLSLLSDVFVGLTDLGASGDAGRVATRLRELGVEVRRPWRGGRKGYGSQLSPRELEVVRLVVAGKSNREIAQLLCKSYRTVGVQLRSAMRKLCVSSRATLAVAAVEAGLAPSFRPHGHNPGSADRLPADQSID